MRLEVRPWVLGGAMWRGEGREGGLKRRGPREGVFIQRSASLLCFRIFSCFFDTCLWYRWLQGEIEDSGSLIVVS